MLNSEPVEFKFRGKPARMQVFRNDGFCWGRITVPSTGEKFDVNTAADHYDDTDEDAIDAFIRAARFKRCVEPAVGWV